MSSYAILIGLIILIIGAPLAIGSVYIVTYSAMEIIVFALLILHIWTLKPENGFDLNSKLKAQSSKPDASDAVRIYLRKTLWLMTPLFVFLAVALFQLVPLPFGMMKVLSPATVSLYHKLGISVGLHPLTLSVYDTTIMLLKWSAYLGVFFLVATFMPAKQALKRGNWIQILCFALFVIGFGEALYGFYSYFQGSESLLWFERHHYKDSVTGTYINRNHFAGFMNMCILVSSGILVSYSSRSLRRYEGLVGLFRRLASSKRTAPVYFLLLGILAMILATIFSLSRMGQFSLAVGLALILMLYASKGMKGSTFIIASLACLGLLWGAWKGLDPVGLRWRAVEKELYEGRMVIWQRTFDLFKNYWITGTGLGTYELAYPPYKLSHLGAEIYDHAHNDYLEVMSETGLSGFIPWVLFFATFLYASIRKWFMRHDILARGIGAGGIAATIAMMYHSFADFNLQIPANALVLFIIMGLTWRTLHSSFGDKQKTVFIVKDEEYTVIPVNIKRHQ